MKNANMTPNDLDSMLKVIVDIYFRMKYKALNYSTTYTKPALEDCMDFIKQRVMYIMCDEVQIKKQELHEWMLNEQDNDQEELDKETMDRRDKQDRQDWWENTMIDKRAEQEAEYRDSLDKPYRDK